MPGPDAAPAFDRTPPEPGRIETVAPGLRRLVAPNGGPFTFSGTCTYVVGHGAVAVVDPGPVDPGHIMRLLAALPGERVEAIFVTHAHRDHCGGVAALAAATGAPVLAAPRPPARALAEDERRRLDAATDTAFVPDRTLGDGERIEGEGWTLTALTTPGHTPDHLCLSLGDNEALLSGDHVMAWSTSIVAPPEGVMADYRASLARLVGRPEAVFWPGHGGPVREPQAFLRGLIAHRRQREAAILRAVAAGAQDVAAIAAAAYPGLDPALAGAARLNTLAHLEELCARGAVVTEGPPALGGLYAPG